MRFGNETEDLITDEEKTGAEAQTGAVAAAVIGGGGGRGRSTDKRLRDRLRYSSNDTCIKHEQHRVKTNVKTKDPTCVLKILNKSRSPLLRHSCDSSRNLSSSTKLGRTRPRDDPKECLQRRDYNSLTHTICKTVQHFINDLCHLKL